MIFDQGLRWNKQTDLAIRKTSNLKSLFKLLTCSKHGPSIESLRTLYIALVRSKLEYGIIAYGSSTKTRQEKLEVAQNSIMRMMLGAPLSTPIKVLQCELALDPMEMRRLWLAGCYQLRVEDKPDHPLSSTSKELRCHPKSWKQHNIPALKLAAGHLSLEDLSHPVGENRPSLPRIPQWKDPPIIFKFFPVPKKEVSSNPVAARSRLHELEDSLNAGLVAYTDGSFQGEKAEQLTQ